MPNRSWIIQYDPSCSRQFCWDMKKPDSGARIYLAKVSQPDWWDLVGEMNKVRNGILENHTNNLANVSEVSPVTFTYNAQIDIVVNDAQVALEPNAQFVYFSWDVTGINGTIRFHAAYVRLIANTTKVYLFVAGSKVGYGESTERDFIEFLNTVRPIGATALSQ